MSSKDVILGRIRTALKDVTDSNVETDAPINWTYGQPDDFITDVIGTFVENVEDYKATVLRTSQGELAATIANALKDRDAKSVVIPSGIPDEWTDTIRSAGLEVHFDEPLLTNYELDKIDAVVTGSFVSVADTGTVILNHDPDQGRRALSLVPDLHICVVRADQVVSGVPEAITMLQEPIRRGQPATWISGGSATSDIELNRVEGVHGPRTLVVVLVE
ncbi:lactate utilization protein C [Stomatohabitans albus]|uniref:LutC/YkgG family protein n=1 Tax=Stomatohabitans albus TaxID=3110766 RepID=UPI00300C72B9